MTLFRPFRLLPAFALTLLSAPAFAAGAMPEHNARFFAEHAALMAREAADAMPALAALRGFAFIPPSAENADETDEPADEKRQEPNEEKEEERAAAPPAIAPPADISRAYRRAMRDTRYLLCGKKWGSPELSAYPDELHESGRHTVTEAVYLAAVYRLSLANLTIMAEKSGASCDGDIF